MNNIFGYLSNDSDGPVGIGGNYKWPVIIPIALLFLIHIAGCDETFQALSENDRFHFSIYGVLDASADTQKVRVTLVRESILSTRDPVDAMVTLEHLGSNQKAILRDSLYSYKFEDTFWAWNYLTEMDLRPEESYRFVARHADGRQSEVTVTLPGDFPEPGIELICGARGLSSVTLDIVDAERIVAVAATYYFTLHDQQNIQKITVQQFDNLRRFMDGSYYVTIGVTGDLRDRLGGESGDISHVNIQDVEVFIANAGPDWPHVEGLSLEEVLLPGEANNVENGAGFLAGIVSKTLSFGNACN